MVTILVARIDTVCRQFVVYVCQTINSHDTEVTVAGAALEITRSRDFVLQFENKLEKVRSAESINGARTHLRCPTWQEKIQMRKTLVCDSFLHMASCMSLIELGAKVNMHADAAK